MQVDNAAKLEMSRRAELLNSRPLNKVGNSLSWVQTYFPLGGTQFICSPRDWMISGWVVGGTIRERQIVIWKNQTFLFSD